MSATETSTPVPLSALRTLVVAIVAGEERDISACAAHVAVERPTALTHRLNGDVLTIAADSGSLIDQLALQLTRLGSSVHVGVSAGDVATVDGTLDGLPVIEAARLAALAEPGVVLIHPRVVSLWPRLASVPMGPVELRGFSEPVEVRRLVEDPCPQQRC